MKNPGYSFTFIINQDVMKPPLYRSYIAGSSSVFTMILHAACPDTTCLFYY